MRARRAVFVAVVGLVLAGQASAGATTAAYTCDAGQTGVQVVDSPQTKKVDANGSGWVCAYESQAGNSAQTHTVFVDDHEGDVIIVP